MLKLSKAILTIVLSVCLLVPMDARASQVVTPDEMHQDLLKSWDEKEQNLATLQQLLSTDAARELMTQAGTDYGKVMQALPQLDDEELSKLASQARVAQANFAAGYHYDTIHLLLIILVIVVIVVVILSVAD